MNQKSIERKTLFLYPNPEELKTEDSIDILNLISDISKICHISNGVISKIMSSGCFATIRCKPSVSLKCVEDYAASAFECENVRICITKYCGKDYSSYYQKVVDDFKNDKSDISHLVAINIGDSKKTYFHSDELNSFDAVIETNLESLDLILESIMLDIALYHYFNLRDDLEDRKKFNSYKWQYITTKFNEEEKKLYFGTMPLEKINYLPFSLPSIKKYNLQRNTNSLKATIDELIKRFGFFVATSINVRLVYNTNCSIRPINSTINYDSFSNFLSENTTTKSLISEKKSFVVQFFYQNSIDFQNVNVEKWLQYVNDEMKVSTYYFCADEGGF